MSRGGLVVMLALVASTPASADDALPDENAVQIHAFVSQGALLTTDNNYLAYTERGSLDFTEAGINFTKQLDDKLTVGTQLFAQDLGPNGSYRVNFDWLFLDYHWRDWLGLRAGRVKLPFGIYNETQDVDAAQPVVLLPQSVYPEADRQFLLAQNGLDLYGYLPIGRAGSLEYEAYFGTLYFSLPTQLGVQFAPVDVPYIGGGRLMWETPVDGLRAGASAFHGTLDINAILSGFPEPITIDLTETQWLASVEYANEGFLLDAEYGRIRDHTTETSLGSEHPTAEHGYALAGYRWRPWLMTTLYYSLMYPRVGDHNGVANQQHDAALSFRFDITAHWIVKLEAHFMRGTAALDSSLNNNVPLSDLTNQWVLFAAKTTAYF
ncbi:MAG TPA: hypothetical protein VGL61_07130 [Kofleriaceae bacterium]